MPRAPSSLRLYALATALAEPFAPVLLAARARRGKEDPDRLGERLGHASRARPDGALVWLHGASVGESLSLLPLIEDLAEARPDLGLLVTSGTRTSAEVIRPRLPARVMHQYLPVDGPRAVGRFLDHWRPNMAVFVESELWPNLLTAAKAREVSLVMLSAKLSDRSFHGWARWPRAAAKLWGGFDLLMAQDARAFERLGALGARPKGVADMKFGAAPLPADATRLADLRNRIGARPLILAASTHSGEEQILLDRFAGVLDAEDRAARHPLLVIVPRHPERGAAIVEPAETLGFAVARQSADESIDDETQVYIADAIGELGLWYRLADLSVIGGSLVAGVGGHNPLEPARLGRPLVSGPHIDNWRAAYAGLIEAGGARIKATDEALERIMGEAIDRNDALTGMGQRARAYVAEQDEAARAARARIVALVP